MDARVHIVAETALGRGRVASPMLGRLLIIIIIKLNPWRYSPEEPRPTEVFAARWQYRGPCG